MDTIKVVHTPWVRPAMWEQQVIRGWIENKLLNVSISVSRPIALVNRNRPVITSNAGQDAITP